MKLSVSEGHWLNVYDVLVSPKSVSRNLHCQVGRAESIGEIPANQAEG